MRLLLEGGFYLNNQVLEKEKDTAIETIYFLINKLQMSLYYHPMKEVYP